MYGAVQATPFVRTFIVGAQTTVSAVTPQTWQGTPHYFSSWSDSGAQTHLITAVAPATLTANFSAAAAPVITAQPSSRVAFAGHDTAFAVTASGTPTPTYQWQVSTDAGAMWNDVADVAPYSGATTPVLFVMNVPLTLDRAGYRVVVTNASGAETSASAALWVTDDTLGIYWRDQFAGLSGSGGGGGSAGAGTINPARSGGSGGSTGASATPVATGVAEPALSGKTKPSPDPRRHKVRRSG